MVGKIKVQSPQIMVSGLQWLELTNIQELEPIDASLLRSTNVQFHSAI